MNSQGCSATCQHADPGGPWPHEVKLEEDAGEIHTDDCEAHNLAVHGPGHDFEDCTAGQPGSKCRVRIVERGAFAIGFYPKPEAPNAR